ncbi:hypothetical protein BGX30_006327, partial [Mortierella sp. GBA39]
MQRGRLTIGCSGNHLLTRTLISFHQKQPGISISVVELATEETRAGLLANKLDLGVVFLPLEDEQLVSKELYTEELCLAVAKQHHLAAAEAVKLDQLTEVPLILFPEKFLVRQMVDSYSAQAGVQLQPAFELSTMDSMLQMVRLGVGATILPRSYLLQGSDPSIRTVPIVEPVPQKK